MLFQRNTNATKAALAVLAGIAIYQAVVFLGGFLAAIAVPRAYFDWFGRPRLELALALVDLATFAIPIVALTTGFTLFSHSLLKAPSARAFMPFVALGALATYAYWAAKFVLVTPELSAGAEAFPASVRLTQLLMPTWWSLPNSLAPWLGFAIAGLLISRRHGRCA